MKHNYILGEFERFALQALVRLRNNAYGMTVRREIEEMAGLSVAIGTVYTALERLEERGLVSSRTGGATPERGWRAKRYYRIEAPGLRSLSGVISRMPENRCAGLVPAGVAHAQ